ncbi:MAG: hypothetical protein RLZZ359_694 [Actinomycetota bacterium]|jgi:rubredoxin
MSQQTMRGMRLGSQSLESERGVNYSARSTFNYECAKGHETSLVFAAEAEVPQTWQCRQCDSDAILLEDGKKVILDAGEDKTPRSHWEMLLERRSRDELEEILQERLDYIRARRAGGQADL